MPPFVPKDGSKAEWAKLYDLLRTGSPGQLFTFAEFDEALGRDFRSARTPIARAIKELEAVENLTVVAVRRQGYRIVQNGQEFVTVGEQRHRRSRRALVRASDAAQAGVRSDLPTAAERGNLLLVSARLARLVQVMGSKLVEHDERITEQEVAVQDHEARLQRLEQGSRL